MMSSPSAEGAPQAQARVGMSSFASTYGGKCSMGRALSIGPTPHGEASASPDGHDVMAATMPRG